MKNSYEIVTIYSDIHPVSDRGHLKTPPKDHTLLVDIDSNNATYIDRQ